MLYGKTLSDIRLHNRYPQQDWGVISISVYDWNVTGTTRLLKLLFSCPLYGIWRKCIRILEGSFLFIERSMIDAYYDCRLLSLKGKNFCTPPNLPNYLIKVEAEKDK